MGSSEGQGGKPRPDRSAYTGVFSENRISDFLTVWKRIHQEMNGLLIFTVNNEVVHSTIPKNVFLEVYTAAMVRVSNSAV